jgi:undecaprenyl phosphate-alpha-L-ara4FN deformylase
MKLALKIDAATFRGTLVGVPRLVEALRAAGAQASFFFNLGPDRSGSILGRLLAESRQGASLIERHGLATRSTAPCCRARTSASAAPRSSAACAMPASKPGCWPGAAPTGSAALRGPTPAGPSARCGAPWIATSGPRRRRRQPMPPPAGRLNPHALRLTQRLGFGFASDTRGTHPFVPVWNAEVVLCPQLPTTLPTLDELLGSEDCNVDNVHERLLALTAEPPSTGHVFTLRRNWSQALLPVLEQLLQAGGPGLRARLAGRAVRVDRCQPPAEARVVRGNCRDCRGT